MQLINAFQDFTAPFVITGGGPLNATYVFAIHLYNSATKYKISGGKIEITDIAIMLFHATVPAVLSTAIRSPSDTGYFLTLLI